VGGAIKNNSRSRLSLAHITNAGHTGDDRLTEPFDFTFLRAFAFSLPSTVER
jgi:hypothetical protein